MIDPNAISTIRVGQLVEAPFNLTDNIPHEVGTDLRRGTINDLSTFIARIIGTTDSLAFLPISVVDGQTLPDTTTNEWFLAGKGTYHQNGGFPDIICTEELNAIVGNGVNWSLGVAIPIVVDPSNKVNTYTVDGTGEKYYTADYINTAIPIIDAVPTDGSTNVVQSNGVFDALALKVAGTGTTNYLPKFTSANVLGNSQIFDNGTNVLIGTTTDNGADKLQVDGSGYFTGAIRVGYVPSGIAGISSYGNVYAQGGKFIFSQGALAYDDGFIGYLESFYAERTGLLRFQGSLANEGYVISGEQYGTETALWAKNVEVARLKPTGAFLIGTTTENNVDKLQVNGSVSASPATLPSQVVIKSQLSKQIVVSTSQNFQESWMDNEIIVTASCTLTCPATLPFNTYNFNFVTLAGVTVTWATTSPFTWEFGTPPNATEKTYGRLVRRDGLSSLILL